jgi:hypothetical protein
MLLQLHKEWQNAPPFFSADNLEGEELAWAIAQEAQLANPIQRTPPVK